MTESQARADYIGAYVITPFLVPGVIQIDVDRFGEFVIPFYPSQRQHASQ